ncbi:hypothetical protein ACILDV_03965 [Capnocytophaga canimorsus]|uniref:Uncharacterized protein n=1 Tax=Capnocytophaga canimorsus (strain 5) TaxID=860228 RepID=F9YTZ0_CAPCC|nr:hypothetical protein [Capnocytophaga canimorsus]AEK22924.1 Hypothetical protein Ccan_08060 [Capnocytophaga canimorsus Cc5]
MEHKIDTLELEMAFSELIKELESIKELNDLTVIHKDNSKKLIEELQNFYSNAKKNEIKIQQLFDKNRNFIENLNLRYENLYEKFHKISVEQQERMFSFEREQQEKFAVLKKENFTIKILLFIILLFQVILLAFKFIP